MSNKTIRVSGCDDYTALDLSLSTEAEAFLRDIFVRINAKSEYGCQPTIYFEGEEPDV